MSLKLWLKAASAINVLFLLNNNGCLLCKSSNWLYKIVESWGEPDDILTDTGILKSSVIIVVLCFLIYWIKPTDSSRNLLHTNVVSV